MKQGASSSFAMLMKPADTTEEAWAMQREILCRLGPEARMAMAIELSDAVLEIQIAGVLSRNPGWDRLDAVRHIVARYHGVELPRRG